MTEERCENCRFWSVRGAETITVCVRFPRVYAGEKHGETNWMYPQQYKWDRCGEWQAKEGQG